jgi:imidazolonepropionase-like amidohydrolase
LSNPHIRKAQTKPVALVGGTTHLGNGQVFENAIVAFESGNLTLVASPASASFNQSGYDIIDISGKHIYPGLIAPDTKLRLEEIAAVRATLDFWETGAINPNVRSLIAYNTDSEVFPIIRAKGVLLAQIVPQGGLISGTSALVGLDAWN